MAYEINPGQLSLFKNNYKQSDRQPDYKGNGRGLEGEPLEVAAWIKTDRNGNKFLSLKLSEPRERTDAQQRPAPTPDPAPQSQSLEPQDDDLPF